MDGPEARARIRANFARCNADALALQPTDRAALYAKLKLDGLDEAPVHLAVCCDMTTREGHGLGRTTMPETLEYSAVASVFSFWLAARAEGLGVGWVSILDAAEIGIALDLPPAFKPIAYLCVGWPVEEHLDPELERAGWQGRSVEARRLLRR